MLKRYGQSLVPEEAHDEGDVGLDALAKATSAVSADLGSESRPIGRAQHSGGDLVYFYLMC